MERDEARKKVLEIRRILLGHPPGNPVEKIAEIAELLGQKTARKAKRGSDRAERGGFDRSE